MTYRELSLALVVSLLIALVAVALDPTGAGDASPNPGAQVPTLIPLPSTPIPLSQRTPDSSPAPLGPRAPSVTPRPPPPRTPPPAPAVPTLDPPTPTAVATAEPPSPTATPTLGPPPGTPAGVTLLPVDFAAYPQWDTAEYRSWFEDGEYVVVKPRSRLAVVVVNVSQEVDDFEAELDARLVDPSPNSYLLLRFRGEDDGDRYSLVVNPTLRTVHLARVLDGEQTVLLDGAEAPAIQGGDAWNRVGVRARGPALALLVNGEVVAEIEDAGPQAGRFGFGVGNADGGPVEGRFRDLLLTRFR